MHCSICNNLTTPIFKKLFLSKYDVSYYRCPNCDFVQTEKPYWLEEAYESAIVNMDVGLLYRNNTLSEVAASVIHRFFNADECFMDYGGGYGILTRLLRDKGYKFYSQDPYCKNLFAQDFDADKKQDSRFELLTSFEVFEHMANPMEEIEKMLSYGRNILFSTELHPQAEEDISNWWYLIPDIGQHVSLWSSKSIAYVAKYFSLQIYSNGRNIHLLSEKKISPVQFKLLTNHKMSFLYNRTLGKRNSLLETDQEYIKFNLMQMASD